MARKQYRWFGEGAWMSACGNAALALQNVNGSGKKVLIHSLEVWPLTVNLASGRQRVELVRAAAAGGTAVTVSPRDSNATLPSGVSVVRGGSVTGTPERFMLMQTNKSFVKNNLPIPQKEGRIAVFGAGVINRRPRDGSVEGITLRPGEAVSFRPAAAVSTESRDSLIVGVFGTFVVHSTPKRTWDFCFETLMGGTESESLVSIINGSASDILTLRDIGFREVGDTTTPYFMVVPVGAIDPQSQSDTLRRLTPVPMDSAYGALDAAQVKLVADAPLLPDGVPVAYSSELGSGSPKGMSYLHTKDFLGPMKAALFPEYTAVTSDPAAVSGGDLRVTPLNQRTANLVTPGAPLVVREGEAIGVVAAMETVSSLSACALPGALPYLFGIQFSVEPTVIPSISLSGIQPGSDVVILDAGTSTVLASGDAISGSTFAWEYDADLVDTVDICVYRQGYIPWTLRNIDPGNAGITLPISQVADRNFVS